MKQSSLTRRLAGAFLAAALAVGGFVAAGSLEAPQPEDPTEEVAGGSWSRIAPSKGGGWAGTHGGTWS